VKTRTEKRRCVFAWFADRWRHHQSKRAEKPHSIIQRLESAERPCYEAELTPLAVENSVGKLAAYKAPNASVGLCQFAYR
jgi:hypothetical protein